MHKYFCDRCGDEVRVPTDEVGMQLEDNMMLSIKNTPHYCGDCSDKVTAALKEAIDVEKVVEILKAKAAVK